MKEDKLGISKTDCKIFMMLDEKQAGELIKALCAYQFNNGTPKDYISDEYVDCLFLLIKEGRDKEKVRTERNRKYMVKYSEKRREDQMSERGEEQKTAKFRIRRK